MAAQNWIASRIWVERNLKELLENVEAKINGNLNRIDVDEEIRGVIERQAPQPPHRGDLPDQKDALRKLVSEKLRQDHPAVLGAVDQEFLGTVLRTPGPITDRERAEHTYLTLLSNSLTPLKIRDSIAHLLQNV